MARGKAAGKDRHGPGRVAEDSGGGADWLTTYADAITLLMAFFMMLYAMSQVDQIKFESLIAGFAVPFGNTAGQEFEDILEGGSGLLNSQFSVNQTPGTLNPIEQPFEDVMQIPPPEDTPESAADGGIDELTGLPLLSTAQLEEVRDELAAALSSIGLDDEVSFDLTQRGLIVSIAADDVLFATGSFRITATGREILGGLAPILAEFGNAINIEGHTDDQPLNRGGYTNWNLSTDRAVSTVTLLSETYGISPTRLAAIGYGEFKPVEPNDSPANRAKNRRVEIVIVAGATA